MAFTHKSEDVSLEFQGRAHWNVEGSRTYPRLGLKGDFKRLGLPPICAYFPPQL